MPTLPAVIVTLLLPFEHLFDPRTWRKAQLLAMGAILSPGKRTVSSALNILGIGQHGDFAIYHHVLNRARWSLLELSRALLLCTNTEAEPLRILQWYLLRWQVEVTFEELRAHLGVETQRQWSERAIARTTPALFGLFSVVTLAADILIEQRGGIAPRTAAWYDKTSPSFADAIALVRRHLWVQQGTFMPSEREHESIRVPRLLYHRMLDTLAYAA